MQDKLFVQFVGVRDDFTHLLIHYCPLIVYFEARCLFMG